jgi:hypothetical protein
MALSLAPQPIMQFALILRPRLQRGSGIEKIQFTDEAVYRLQIAREGSARAKLR